MRYSRILAAFILTTSLIILLVIPSSAAEVYDLYVCDAWLYYQPDQGGDPIYTNVLPDVNDDGTFTFNLTEHINDNGNQTDLRSIAILMYPEDIGYVECERGYIYTYNFTVRMTRVTNPSDFYFEFGICDSSFTEVIPMADVTYSYSGTSAMKTYSCTAVMYIDDTFSFGSLKEDIDTLCCYLDITGTWSGDVTLRNLEQRVSKAVGEDAYYEASLEAINNLPQSEYDFVMSKMPDEQGMADNVNGDIDDMLNEVKLEINGFYDIITAINYNEPLIYFPSINIPLGDGVNIDVINDTPMRNYIDGEGFFRPLAMLASMNGNIVSWINTFVVFIRFVAVIGFLTVGLYKMLHVEWWT